MAYSIRFPRRHDKADRNGRYAVRLCITKNKRRKYIALDLYADPAYWDEAGEQFIILRNLIGAEQKAENKQREAGNALLAKYKVRAREIVERFEIEGIDWTLNQFEDAFLNTSKQGKFNAYFSDRIAELHATGHIGNSQTYKQTQDILKSYDRKLDQRLFSDIDLRYVRGFDMFLQKRGCCGNTRRFYFKALRAILNRANAEGVGSAATYPFGRGGFEVSKLEEATAKRYRRAVETQKHHGQQSAMRIRPQVVSILLLLLRHFVHRHGDAHGRPYQTDGGRRLYRLQEAEDQTAERGQTDFDQNHASDPATDREPASGLADRGRFPAADRHPLRLYGRATLHAHSGPLQQVSKIPAPARRGARNRFSPDELRLPPYGGHDLAAQQHSARGDFTDARPCRSGDHEHIPRQLRQRSDQRGGESSLTAVAV